MRKDGIDPSQLDGSDATADESFNDAGPILRP